MGKLARHHAGGCRLRLRKAKQGLVWPSRRSARRPLMPWSSAAVGERGVRVASGPPCWPCMSESRRRLQNPWCWSLCPTVLHAGHCRTYISPCRQQSVLRLCPLVSLWSPEPCPPHPAPLTPCSDPLSLTRTHNPRPFFSA